MRYIALALLLAASCGGQPTPETADMNVPPVDMGPSDAGQDAGIDLGMDSGPSCECTSGPCCDGCHFRPSTYACSTSVASACQGNSLCQGQGRIAHVVTETSYCTGDSSWCSASPIQTVADTDCRVPNGVDWLTYGRCDPTGVAHCVDGPDCVTTY